MAKIEGTQDIPSDIALAYSALLSPKLSGSQIRRRCPFTRPTTKAGAIFESDAQRVQRNRFKTVRDEFNKLNTDQRSNWYESAPVWNSFLWYYNWFMLSGLMGVSGIPGHFEAVIKTIAHYTFTLASGEPANVTVSIDSVNAEKAVVMFYGGGAYEVGEGAAVPCYPYLVELKATEAIVKASMTVMTAAGCSLTVIEYI